MTFGSDGTAFGRWAAAWLLCASAPSSACAREQPEAAPEAKPTSAAGAEAPQAESPFRFEPTLRSHVPAGAEIAPLFEISEPAAYQVRIVAAIERPGEPLAIELMTFDMRNEREVLEPKGEPVTILRVRSDQPRAVELDELRRRHAAPGVEVRRPQGLPGADPMQAVARLQSAAAMIGDPNATARARVHALADLVHGLDDAIVLQRDALPETMELLLAIGPATGHEQASERRAIVTTASHRLELARKRDGWTLVSIDPR
jgi:hypothetical protein